MAAPLFAGRTTRAGKTVIQRNIDTATRPCFYTEECPHGCEIEGCEANCYSAASKYPASKSPHRLRHRYITAALNAGQPVDVTAERTNVSREVLDKNYDARFASEKRGDPQKILGRRVTFNQACRIHLWPNSQIWSTTRSGETHNFKQMGASLISMSELDFEYEGFLVFSPVQTEVRGKFSNLREFELREELGNYLPRYEQGSPEEPGEGFSTIDLFEKLQQSTEIPNSMRRNLESLVSFQYIHEDYREVEAYVDNRLTEVMVPSKQSAELYWFVPDLVLFRGKQSDIEMAMNYFEREEMDDLLINRLGIDPDFLTQIYHREEGELFPNCRLKQIQGATLSGYEFASQVKLSGDLDDLENFDPPGGSVEQIQGVFSYYGFNIVADISMSRIHIRTSKGDMKISNSLNRMGIAISFVKDLIEYYTHNHDFA